MFLVKADTTISVQRPAKDGWFYTTSWMPYQTKEDKIYDKHEVFDLIRVTNAYETIPDWIRINVLEHGMIVLSRDGKYALVSPWNVTYLD